MSDPQGTTPYPYQWGPSLMWMAKMNIAFAKWLLRGCK